MCSEHLPYVFLPIASNFPLPVSFSSANNVITSDMDPRLIEWWTRSRFSWIITFLWATIMLKLFWSRKVDFFGISSNKWDNTLYSHWLTLYISITSKVRIDCKNVTVSDWLALATTSNIDTSFSSTISVIWSYPSSKSSTSLFVSPKKKLSKEAKWKTVNSTVTGNM